MYRVLASRDEVRDRRAQAAHPPRVRPELVADGPDQVWTWDITKLKSEWRGLYFDLYVMIDIYSRKAINWEIHATENGDLAKEFIENYIKANGGAQFKTLKYCPVFPGKFASLGEAREFCELFFPYYNTQHRHSGIALHTPQSVHDGTWREIRARRQQVLDAAYAARPDRFRRPPTAPELPRKTWINQPRPTIESQEDTAAYVHTA
jgi:putative transposase